eukprot:1157795-Pelagomonas_calceolata.AAC.3
MTSMEQPGKSGRRGPENKEAYFNLRLQTWGWNSVLPSGLLNFQSMNTKSTSGHAAYNVFSWESIPVMVSGFFAVDIERIICGKLSPVCQVARPEIHCKLAQIQRMS